MLVRMLNISKWDHDCIKQRKQYYGDAISDLKCSQNTLSVWKADNLKEIEEAVLALALGREVIQKMAIVILDENNILDKYKVTITETPGNVPIKRLQNRHRYLSNIDYWCLGFIAEHIGDQLNNPVNYKIFTRKEIEQLIRDAINQDKDLINNINPKLKENLKI